MYPLNNDLERMPNQGHVDPAYQQDYYSTRRSSWQYQEDNVPASPLREGRGTWCLGDKKRLPIYWDLCQHDIAKENHESWGLDSLYTRMAVCLSKAMVTPLPGISLIPKTPPHPQEFPRMSPFQLNCHVNGGEHVVPQHLARPPLGIQCKPLGLL